MECTCDLPTSDEHGGGWVGSTVSAVYLNDVVIYSDTWEEHLACIKQLFDRLSDACLTINLAQYEFAKATVIYLG